MGLNVARVVLEGELGDVALPELVQLLCSSRNSREIDVSFEGHQVGSLVIHGGRVVRCVAFGRAGLEAFFHLMQQRDGRYVVRTVDDQASGSIHPSLAETTWESLLMEAARRQDLISGVRPTHNDDDIDPLDGFDAFLDPSPPPGSLLPPPLSHHDATPYANLAVEERVDERVTQVHAPRAAPPTWEVTEQRVGYAPPVRESAPREAPEPHRSEPRRDTAELHGGAVPPAGSGVHDPLASSAERVAWEPPQPRRQTSSPPAAYGSAWAPLASRASRSSRGLPRTEEPRRGSPTAVVRAPTSEDSARRVPYESTAVSARSSYTSRSSVEDASRGRVSYEPEEPRVSRATLDDPRYDRPSDPAGLYDDRTQISHPGANIRPSERLSNVSPASQRRPAASEARVSPPPASRRSLPGVPPSRPSIEGPPSSATSSSQSAYLLRERATEAYLRRDLHQALRLFEASLALAPGDERSKANVARIRAKLGLR